MVLKRGRVPAHNWARGTKLLSRRRATCGPRGAPEQGASCADVRLSQHCRNFALSGELETDKIDANLTVGFMTMRIPNRAERRARKIKIQAHR